MYIFIVHHMIKVLQNLSRYYNNLKFAKLICFLQHTHQFIQHEYMLPPTKVVNNLPLTTLHSTLNFVPSITAP